MVDTLIFGVDGMNPRVAQQLAEDGEMPNLQDLRERDEAVDGIFESYIEDGYTHPHTGPCWTSIYTGVEPSDHGITEGGWREGDSNFDGIRTVWDVLSENDVSMTLYGMPMTYPAKDVNGWMVSGFISTTLKSMFGKCIKPDAIEDVLPDDLREVTASYVAKRLLSEGGQPSQPTDEGFDTLKTAEERRLDIFEDMFEDDVDIAAYGTTFADKMGHINGIALQELDIEDDVVHDTEAYTRRTYRFIDAMLGRLIDATNPDDVVIISDHGFTGLSHSVRGYYLNTAGEELDSIFDFAPFITEHFVVPYDASEYGEVEASSLTDEEKEDIEQRLKDLGYIE